MMTNNLMSVLIGVVAMAGSYVAASVIAHSELSKQTPAEYFSSAVSILDGSNDICSGTILNKRWVITSANCIEKYKNVRNLQLLYGSDNRQDDKRLSVAVEKVQIHPEFNSETLVNNIALIKTQKNMKLSGDIEAVKLPTTETFEDDLAYAIGWKHTDERSQSNKGDILKHYQTKVMALDLCWERVDDVDEAEGIRIPDSVICTYGPSNKRLPLLDNGSALISTDRYELIGIASWYKQNLPKIYTRIYSMIPWIQSILNE